MLDKEKMKDSFRLSKMSSFSLPQGSGVYPPTTFPCSVSQTVKVSINPSHDWWNHPMSKLYSEAQKRSFASLIGLCEKNFRILFSSSFVLITFENLRNGNGNFIASSFKSYKNLLIFYIDWLTFWFNSSNSFNPFFKN